MIDYVEIATFIFLFIFFAATEIYRLKTPERGIIRAIEPIAGGLGGYQAKVKLHTGKEEEVYISPCVMCAGRFILGSEVLVHRTKDRTVASAPLVCSRKG